jgi:hypothetical protein
MTFSEGLFSGGLLCTLLFVSLDLGLYLGLRPYIIQLFWKVESI